MEKEKGFSWFLGSCKLFVFLFLIKQVRAEKVVIERDDVGEGLVEIVADRGITKLVMGAASEKQYSRYEAQVLLTVCHFT